MDVHYVPVVFAAHLVEAMQYKSVLDDAGVPYMVRGASPLQIHLGDGGQSPHGEQIILVPAHLYDAAVAALAPYCDIESLDSGAPPVEGLTVCPACGADNPQRNEKCPACGLFLG